MFLCSGWLDFFSAWLTSCPLLVFSITYVPAEYLEEYKASLERTAEDVFSETRWVLHRGLFDRRRPENGFSKRVSFLKILGGRDVPILPEREDGEGEESASYSNWNQPRR